MKKQSAIKSLTFSSGSQGLCRHDNEDAQSLNFGLRLLAGPVLSAANESAPWLDQSGQPLTLGRLKQRCKTWPLEVWQLYCEHLEVEQGAVRESRISPKTLEEELSGMTYEIDECLEGPRDFSKLHKAINSLDSIQRTIIQKVFWSGQTMRSIAREMRLPRSTVQDLKSAALAALYAKIPDTCPLIRGEVDFLPQKEGRKRAA